METHEFDIAIGPDGTVRVETHGVKGAACEEYLALFQKILAGEGAVERTAEYYEPPTGVSINLEQRT